VRFLNAVLGRRLYVPGDGSIDYFYFEVLNLWTIPVGIVVESEQDPAMRTHYVWQRKVTSICQRIFEKKAGFTFYPTARKLSIYDI